MAARARSLIADPGLMIALAPKCSVAQDIELNRSAGTQNRFGHPDNFASISNNSRDSTPSSSVISVIILAAKFVSGTLTVPSFVILRQISPCFVA
jgi:hypothetical protein